MCPYYYPKRVKHRGTLYIMPYFYIFDEMILLRSKLLYSNSIVIFDEGHNIVDAACKGFSNTFVSSLIDGALNNILDKDD